MASTRRGRALQQEERVAAAQQRKREVEESVDSPVVHVPGLELSGAERELIARLVQRYLQGCADPVAQGVWEKLRGG